MKTFASVILVVCLAHLSQQNDKYKLTIANKDVGNSEVPVNPIAKQCGGPGKLHQQRNTLCANPDCKGPNPTTDIIMESDVTFSKNIAQLGWRNVITKEGKEPFTDHDGPVTHQAAGPVNAGTLYLFQARIKPALDGLKGKASAKYEFYDMADKSVDICIEAQFEFV